MPVGVSAAVSAMLAWWRGHPAGLSVLRELRGRRVRAAAAGPEPDRTDYIAYGSLAPNSEPHSGLVGKELNVSGSILAVRWNAKDSRLLRISIINFLDQLSLVVKTMQRFGPPVPR